MQQKMEYFKQHFESCDSEWTIYGCYSDLDIQREGDVLCEVYEIRHVDSNEHIDHNAYKEYIEPDEVTFITKEEYLAVVNKLHEVDDYYSKADDVLKTLI